MCCLYTYTSIPIFIVVFALFADGKKEEEKSKTKAEMYVQTGGVRMKRNAKVNRIAIAIFVLRLLSGRLYEHARFSDKC